MQTLQQRFKSIINIVKRVHHTEEARTGIIADLSAITEKEYEDISGCSIVDQKSAEIIVQLLNSEIGLTKACYEEQCFLCEGKEMPKPEPPTEQIEQLQKIIHLFNL
jgi:hypothetical protein